MSNKLFSLNLKIFNAPINSKDLKTCEALINILNPSLVTHWRTLTVSNFVSKCSIIPPDLEMLVKTQDLFPIGRGMLVCYGM